jgi:hypothetical protein
MFCELPLFHLRPGALPREPGRPKRPQNPFFQFCHDQRKKVAAEYLLEHNVDLSKKDLTKILAEKWRGLPAEEKKVNTVFSFYRQ